MSISRHSATANADTLRNTHSDTGQYRGYGRLDYLIGLSIGLFPVLFHTSLKLALDALYWALLQFALFF